MKEAAGMKARVVDGMHPADIDFDYNEGIVFEHSGVPGKVRTGSDPGGQRIELPLDVPIGSLPFTGADRTLVPAYCEVFDDAVFDRVNAVFAADPFPLLHDELFVCQRTRTGHSAAAAFNPREYRFSPALDLIA